MQDILDLYHLEALDIRQMDGYGSINYQIETEEGLLVIKHYKEPEEFPILREEIALLNELAPQLPFLTPCAPVPLKELPDGTLTRLYHYIEGQLLGKAVQTDELLTNFGRSAGLLSQALAGRRGLAIEARKLIWDQQYCLMNRSKVRYIRSATHRKWVDYFLDQFAEHVAPIQYTLRHSIIHGDLNEQNVLVENDAVVGFIDFGDLCYSPLVNEIAVAMAYSSLMNKQTPLEKIEKILAAYHEVFPLLPEEVDLLYYLIPVRLCVSVVNSSETQALETDTEYIVQNQQDAWDILEQWVGFNPVGLSNRFRKRLGMESLGVAASILEKRQAMLAPSLSLSYKKPVQMYRAAFQYMFDPSGNTYLDAYNNIPQVGHCHPRISQVISSQVRKLNTNTRYLYQELTDYTEKLLSHFPPVLNKVFLVNSGSEAGDLALRIARHFTQRKGVAVLENGYHGHSSATIEASAYKFEGKGGSGPKEHILRLSLPKLYQGEFTSASEYVEDAKKRIESYGLARNYDPDANPHWPAALIAEPVSGCGGQVPLAPGYLNGLKPFLEANGILTIMDEVQTGFGRLGDHFWGFQMLGIVPDLVVLGKPMGNGHPMGAVVTTEAIAEAFANGMEFFSSFGGNPVSCAVGLEVLKIIEEEELQENAKVVGEYYREELRKLQVEYPVIGDVRGHGLFIGFEFTTPKGQPDTETAQRVKEEMKEKYILLSTDGPFDNVIKSKPPLCFTKKNVDQVVSTLRECLQQL